MQLAGNIRNQLRYLKQDVRLQLQGRNSASDTEQIQITAEFYRVAACLYLEQIANDSSDGAKYVQALVQEGFNLLAEMRICTSPWPLFILACHTISDERRLQILQTIEAMQSKRRIGNVQVLEGIIKAVWRREDLLGRNVNGSAHSSSVDWRHLITMDSPMPTFV